MFEQIKLLCQVALCVCVTAGGLVFWKIYNSLEPGTTVSITLLRNQHEQPFTFVKPKN